MSDREKLSVAHMKNYESRGYEISDLEAESYRTGAEAKDREWQARVAGLVSKVRGMLIEREAVGYTLNHDERNGARIAVEMLSGAVKLLNSGQPAIVGFDPALPGEDKTVMLDTNNPEAWSFWTKDR